MENLKSGWLTEGLIDFEYKKYILMAYFKDVRHNFSMHRLYPFLSDLIFHFRNLNQVRENKRMIYDQFPQTISKADFEKLKVTYTKIIDDNEMMKELSDIIEFALIHFKELVEEGKDIYEFVEENIEIIPVGLSPLYAGEGYLLIEEKKNTEMEIYRYQITLFEGADEKYQGVHTQLLEKIDRNLSMTYEKIKLMLVKRYADMPNPATYLLCAKHPFPHYETLLPVAKRLLVKHIQSTTGSKK